MSAASFQKDPGNGAGSLREIRSLDTPGQEPIAPSRLGATIRFYGGGHQQPISGLHGLVLATPGIEVIAYRHFITQIYKYTSLGNQNAKYRQVTFVFFYFWLLSLLVHDLDGYPLKCDNAALREKKRTVRTRDILVRLE